MSKSKGEFLTVSLLKEKGYNPLVYRFFCLQSHYRRNLVFSWENLDNARVAYDKLVQRVAALSPKADEVLDEAAFADGRARFTEALDNDLNTSLAVTALYDVFKLKTNDKTKLMLVQDFDRVLDLGLIKASEELKKNSAEENADSEVSPELLAYINEKIEARRAAKKAKDFALADAIRDELLAKGITLLDTREGTKFSIN
jgi:cysteinyl-tRNA synthetase